MTRLRTFILADDENGWKIIHQPGATWSNPHKLIHSCNEGAVYLDFRETKVCAACGKEPTEELKLAFYLVHDPTYVPHITWESEFGTPKK